MNPLLRIPIPLETRTSTSTEAITFILSVIGLVRVERLATNLKPTRRISVSGTVTENYQKSRVKIYEFIYSRKLKKQNFFHGAKTVIKGNTYLFEKIALVLKSNSL